MAAWQTYGEGGCAATGLRARRRRQADAPESRSPAAVRRDVRRGGAHRFRAAVSQCRGGPRLRPRPRQLLHGARVDRGVDLGSWIRWHVGGTSRRGGSWSRRSRSAFCAGSQRRTNASARWHGRAGRPSRRVAAQRAADDPRHGEADRFRARAGDGSPAGDDRARHREGQDVVSRAGDRRRRAPDAGVAISSRAARCCGRRWSAASCSTARPTTRRTPAARVHGPAAAAAPPRRAAGVRADHPPRAGPQRRTAISVGARDGAPDRYHAQEGPAAQGPPHRAVEERRRRAPGHGPRAAHRQSVGGYADRADRRRRYAAHRARAQPELSMAIR